MRAGLRYVRHSPPLQMVLVRVAAFVAAGERGLGAAPALRARRARARPAGLRRAARLLRRRRGGRRAPAAPACARALGAQRLATGAALAFAAASSLLGALPALAAAAVALVVAGGAWLALLTTLNAAAQMALPAWVRARGLATLPARALRRPRARAARSWGALAGAVGVPRTLRARRRSRSRSAARSRWRAAPARGRRPRPLAGAALARPGDRALVRAASAGRRS